MMGSAPCPAAATRGASVGTAVWASARTVQSSKEAARQAWRICDKIRNFRGARGAHQLMRRAWRGGRRDGLRFLRQALQDRAEELVRVERLRHGLVDVKIVERLVLFLGDARGERD